MLRALTVALTVAVGVLTIPSLSVRRTFETCEKQQYDVTQVDWAGLRGDLKTFAAACDCTPILLRLSWHDSGTYAASDDSGGSRGAQRFPEGESTHGANAGLSVARGLLQPYKEKYPEVGYADLWALAAIVAIETAGGPSIAFRGGRTDIKTSAGCVAEGRLPDGDKGASHIRKVFNRMGFEDGEIVALSGGHTLGRCHADRSGFEGPWDDTPLAFDNDYFKQLLGCEWGKSVASTGNPQMACAAKPGLMMLTTDHALVTDPALRKYTEQYATDEQAFRRDFAVAFQKLQEHGHHSLSDISD